MISTLDDHVKQAQYGEIYLVRDGRRGHYTIPSGGWLNKLMTYYNILQSVTLEKLAKISPSLRRKIAGNGIVSWVDRENHLILISMVTPPGSYLTVPATLINEIERIAKIKGYLFVGVHTTLSQRIMETAGWICVGRQYFPYITKSYIKMVN